MNLNDEAKTLLSSVDAAGYERGFNDGIAAALKAVSAALNGLSRDVPAPKPVAKPKRKAKKRGPSKAAVVREMIRAQIAAGQSIDLDHVAATARDKNARITRQDVNNAIQTMRKEVEMVEPGVYVKAQPNGEATPAT